MGTAITVTLYVPEGMSFNTFYQFGPTPDDPTDHWYEFLFDGASGAEISSGIVTIHYVDGLRGDHDLIANGVILDPGAPALDKIPWHNRKNPNDVDNDGHVAPLDVLIIINELNQVGSRQLPLENFTANRFRVDADGDGHVAPIDALLVINYLNRPVGSEGENAVFDVWSERLFRADESKHEQSRRRATTDTSDSSASLQLSHFWRRADQAETFRTREYQIHFADFEPLLSILALDVLGAREATITIAR